VTVDLDETRFCVSAEICRSHWWHQEWHLAKTALMLHKKSHLRRACSSRQTREKGVGVHSVQMRVCG